MTDYYKILGVSRFASEPEIKRAYRELAKKYHPDVNSGGGDAFGKITEANTVLSDPAKRRNYDARLAAYSQTKHGRGGRASNPGELSSRSAAFEKAVKEFAAGMPAANRDKFKSLLEQSAKVAGLKVELHFDKVIEQIKTQAAVNIQEARSKAAMDVKSNKNALNDEYRRSVAQLKERLVQIEKELKTELTETKKKLTETTQSEKQLKEKLTAAELRLKRLENRD